MELGLGFGRGAGDWEGSKVSSWTDSSSFSSSTSTATTATASSSLGPGWGFDGRGSLGRRWFLRRIRGLGEGRREAEEIVRVLLGFRVFRGGGGGEEMKRSASEEAAMAASGENWALPLFGWPLTVAEWAGQGWAGPGLE